MKHLNTNAALRSKNLFRQNKGYHKGISPPKSCILSREKAPVHILHVTFMFIDSPRINIKMTIISPKSLTYFPSPLYIPSSVVGDSLVVPGGQ